MDLELLTAEPQGDARPHSLLFVHGAWHGAWCWQDHFFPFFASRGFHCRALSLRGHGASPGGALRWTSIGDYVADLAAVVDSLPHSPVLVGHSMGGLVVQKYLEERSAPAAALLATSPRWGAWRATLRVLRRHPGPFLKANASLRLGPLVATPGLARAMFFSVSMPDDEVAHHQSRLQDESYRAYLGMLLRLPRPRRVRTPIVVVGAADDAIFSPAEQQATARSYRTSATIVPGLAHDVMLDTNWERAATALLDGLDAVLSG